MKIQIPINRRHSYYSYPKSVALVTTVDAVGKVNIMTVAWHTPISHNPALYGISISPDRHSHDMIIESKEFVINFPSYDMAEKALFCGTISGKDVDKFEQTGLTPIPASKVRPPLIEECYCHLECELFDKRVYGDHTFFVGRILNILVDDGVFEKDLLRQGRKPLHFVGDKTFTTVSEERKAL